MATIEGTENSEFLIGTDFADFVFGNGGSDTISGLAGRDRLSGGNDDDTLFGDEGQDRLSGDLGRDHLFGGANSDIFIFISGDTGVDRVRDYQDETDLLNVRNWDVVFEDLRFRETANGNLVVRGDDLGEKFVIVGATEAQMDRGDFLF